MHLIQALILSLVEGITEFLPISSTGHLILVSKILGMSGSDFQKTFEIVIQFGAIAAVIVIYFQSILKKRYLWKQLFIAFLPAGFVGFILYKLIKNYLLGNSLVTVAALILGGIVMILFEKFFTKTQTNKIEKLTIFQTF